MYLGASGIYGVRVLGLGFRVYGGFGFRVYGGFPKNLGYFLADPKNKDCSILGVYIGVPSFRETTMSLVSNLVGHKLKSYHTLIYTVMPKP